MALVNTSFGRRISGFLSSVNALVLAGVIVGTGITYSLYNRYQSELQNSLRVYRLEEADRVNLDRVRIEAAFQATRNALLATSQSPAIRRALSTPGSNAAELTRELLPAFVSLGANCLHIVTSEGQKPVVQTIAEAERYHKDTEPELDKILSEFKSRYPALTSAELAEYPLSIGGLRPSSPPSESSKLPSQEIPLAIPLFAADGTFVGALAAGFDSKYFSSKLSDSNSAVVHPSSGFASYQEGFGTVGSYWESAREGRDVKNLAFSTSVKLDFGNQPNAWRLWSTKFDSDFWARSDVGILKSNLVSSVVFSWGMLALGILFMSRMRRRQEDRFQGLLRNSTEVILLCDEAGEISQVGGQVRQLLGWKSEQMSGVSLSLFLAPDSRREFQGLLSQVSKTPQKSCSLQVQVEKPDKSFRWHELVATNLLNDLEVGGVVITLRNIEAQKSAEQMLIQSKESAERANLAKSEFLSRMSHELRTPLNAILGFGQLLQMSELSEPDRESVDQVLKGGRHLLGLINDILDISRIESNSISVSKEPVMVSELVHDCASQVQLLAQSRGIELRVKIPDDVYFRADRQRAAQVVINLLSNAVKYNREGGTVEVEVTKTQSDVYLSVKDTGQGISDELLPRLFTPFDRLGADRSTVEGTGLGLSLSKTLIEAMDGRINVVSKVGEGTTFVIALPAAAARKGVQLKLVNGFDENETRILCIEDNEVNLHLMRQMFAPYSNVKLLEAREGWLGIAVAREQVPDLILLDNNLPDIDAVRVIEELRANPVTKTIDVFVVSADVSTERISACLAAGARQFIQKPIDINTLFSALNEDQEAA